MGAFFVSGIASQSLKQKTGLFAPIFWLAPKGFPLLSLARPRAYVVLG
jgi:hypothetical protein